MRQMWPSMGLQFSSNQRLPRSLRTNDDHTLLNIGSFRESEDLKLYASITPCYIENKKEKKHIAVYLLKGNAIKHLFCYSWSEAYASPKFFVSTWTTKAMKLRVQVRIEENDSICTRSTDSLIMHLMFLGVFDVVHSILRGNLAIVKPDWMRSRLSGEFYTCFVSSTLKIILRCAPLRGQLFV